MTSDSGVRRVGRRVWVAFAVLAMTQFMTVLDTTIVNIGLPAIGRDFQLSTGSLQWVITAYVVLFGGFLMLGGRAADLLGRRRVFLVGTVLFTVASLVGGFAWSEGSLVVARGVQGLGAAMLSPAALALVTTLFTQDREQRLALGLWGALAGIGGTMGVVAGGLLVNYLGWRWILFVNVPVGLAMIPAALRLVPKDPPRSAQSAGDPSMLQRYDLPGAATITAALCSLSTGWCASAMSAGWRCQAWLSLRERRQCSRRSCFSKSEPVRP
jgi:MFS family permease